MSRRFAQVDVFTDAVTLGNPVAVVLDAERLTEQQMQTFAAWTNLSETTFVLPPTVDDADYRLRIFTTQRELPFAGHPTLGSAAAWLAAGGRPAGERIVQECGAGLVPIRRDGDRLAFAAPPLLRSGPVDRELVDRLAAALELEGSDVLDAQWCDNGPGWVALLLRDADLVLSRRPTTGDVHPDVGLVGAYPSGSDVAVEVRAFIAGDGHAEDPVTGSLNAALAQWLIPAGVLPAAYTASQGTALGRRGRVFVKQHDGAIWVGGHTVVAVSGSASL